MRSFIKFGLPIISPCYTFATIYRVQQFEDRCFIQKSCVPKNTMMGLYPTQSLFGSPFFVYDKRYPTTNNISVILLIVFSVLRVMSAGHHIAQTTSLILVWSFAPNACLVRRAVGLQYLIYEIKQLNNKSNLQEQFKQQKLI